MLIVIHNIYFIRSERRLFHYHSSDCIFQRHLVISMMAIDSCASNHLRFTILSENINEECQTFYKEQFLMKNINFFASISIISVSLPSYCDDDDTAKNKLKAVYYLPQYSPMETQKAKHLISTLGRNETFK